MILSSSLDHVKLQGAWLTIGIFDGVHRGHQALLGHLVAGAKAANLPAIVLTLDPHPAVVLGGKTDFKFLNTNEERASLLASLGVDFTINQKFDRDFADQTAAEFIMRCVQFLGLRSLVLGHDTALGRGRRGDAPTLAKLGQEMGFTVKVVPALYEGTAIISSSRIRSLIQEGQVESASYLLGRSYSISGTVIHGDGRGRHINIPTANLEIVENKLIPANGIYATWAYIEGKRFQAATNIGTNPTFTPGKMVATIETHILDLKQDLYGKEIRLEFIKHLRDEIRFPSKETLISQIRADIQDIRKILNNNVF